MSVKAVVLVIAFILFLLGAVLSWFGLFKPGVACIGAGLALWEVTTIKVSVDS